MNKVILVVDDEDYVRKFIGRALERLGFDVVMRECPIQAFPFVDVVHGVVTDFSMPNMNGVEFTRLIKQKRPGLPVIIATANDFRDLPPHEADYLVQKPMPLDTFREALVAVGLIRPLVV